MILASALGVSLVIWLLVVVVHLISKKSLKFSHFSFSEKNYYIMMSGIPLAILLISIYSHDAHPIALFLFFALTGVCGETLFSMWWHRFFGQRFWVYTTETVYHSYTSILNFIPWGIAGMFTIEIAQVILGKSLLHQVFLNGKTYGMLGIIYFGCLLVQFSLWYLIAFLFHRHEKLHEVTWINYAFFAFPILAIILYFGFTFSYNFFILAAVFGTFWFIEYFFGKGTQFFISKKLWSYTYVTFDNGHFSPLSIIPFMVTGFWFLIIYGFFATYLLA